jgi:DGQHR domain-containing protein
MRIGEQMASFSDGLVFGDGAKKVSVARSKRVDVKTVTAAKKDALFTKVQGEEQDGWYVVKRNKHSVRMAKAKPDDRQLEDDIWSLLYKLGFKEFNADRNFTIKVGPNAPARQIDVFAKDDETVFIVECTHAQESGSKSIKGLIDKINGIRDDAIKAIHAQYGKEPKLKVKWAIATKNVDWRKADKDRAAEAKIAVITEHDIAYYTKLTAYLKEAARYQFLARHLQGEGVDGLQIKVPATKGSMGGVPFYNFLISPFELLKISYISHKATSADDLETYQRMVKPSRLKVIAKYIDNGGQFPTNIVINFKTKKSKLQFQKIQSFENSVFGTLTLPGQYGSAWIIDGQHRLYGFAFSKRGKKHVVPVLAYENLPTAEEMRQFVDINCEQVKVSRGLLNEIYSNLNYGSDDPAEQLEAQYSRIALRLDELPNSPIKDRVVTVANDKDNFRCLTLTSLADGIQENRFLGTVTQTPPNTTRVQPGPLSHSSCDLDLTTEKAADVFAGYFDLFAKGVPGNWQLGDAKGGFLCTNNGLRALLRLLKDLIIFIERDDHIKMETMSAEDIVEKVAAYTAPLIEFFTNASQDEIQNFRSRQALDGVKRNCLGMMGIISESRPAFKTPELQNYLDSRDKEGTTIAHNLIDEINLTVHKDVLDQLKKSYPNGEEWWLKVPLNTRKKCDEHWNNDNGAKNRWQYLSLADYQTIVTSNWELFDKRYDFGDKGKSSKKADKVSWIGHVNKIRQTTHHPEKGLISKDEVAWIKEIYAHVMNNIAPTPKS